MSELPRQPRTILIPAWPVVIVAYMLGYSSKRARSWLAGYEAGFSIGSIR